MASERDFVYIFTNNATGQVLKNEGDATLTTRSRSNDTKQMWTREQKDDVYYFMNIGTGHALDGNMRGEGMGTEEYGSRIGKQERRKSGSGAASRGPGRWN